MKIVAQLIKFVKTDMSDREIKSLTWLEGSKIIVFRLGIVACFLVAIIGVIWAFRHV